jgi:hypothetical protein
MGKDKMYNFSELISIILEKVKILELLKEDYLKIGKNKNGLHQLIHMIL